MGGGGGMTAIRAAATSTSSPARSTSAAASGIPSRPGWRPGGRAWRPIRSASTGVIDDPAFLATFRPVGGDSLKRVPPGYPADHPEAELLKLKDVTFGRRLSDEDAMSPKLPETIADAFAVATPVMRLLAELPVA